VLGDHFLHYLSTLSVFEAAEMAEAVATATGDPGMIWLILGNSNSSRENTGTDHLSWRREGALLERAANHTP